MFSIAMSLVYRLASTGGTAGTHRICLHYLFDERQVAMSFDPVCLSVPACISLCLSVVLPCRYVPVCLSLCPCLCRYGPVCLSVCRCLLFVSVALPLSVCVVMALSVALSLSVSLRPRLSVCPCLCRYGPVCLCRYGSVCRSVGLCLSVCLSVCRCLLFASVARSLSVSVVMSLSVCRPQLASVGGTVWTHRRCLYCVFIFMSWYWIQLIWFPCLTSGHGTE